MEFFPVQLFARSDIIGRDGQGNFFVFVADVKRRHENANMRFDAGDDERLKDVRANSDNLCNFIADRLFAGCDFLNSIVRFCDVNLYACLCCAHAPHFFRRCALPFVFEASHSNRIMLSRPLTADCQSLIPPSELTACGEFVAAAREPDRRR